MNKVYDRLWNKVRNESCELCGLCEYAQTVCMMGADFTSRGVIVGQGMIIGEVPGYHEDQTQIPFSGDAGKLLRRALSEAGLEDAGVYITNAVKCRTPENRTPTNKEIKLCNDYLRKEIVMVKPKVIFALGNTALKALGVIKSNKGGITKMRGNVYNVTIEGVDVTILAGLHPAFILRDLSKYSLFIQDVERFATMLKGESNVTNKRGVRMKMVRSRIELDAMYKDILQSGRVCIDVETNSRDLNDPKWDLVSIALCVTDRENKLDRCYAIVTSPRHRGFTQGKFDTCWSYASSLIVKILLDTRIKLIGQNIKFDLSCLIRKFDLNSEPLNLEKLLDGRIDDTLVIAHLLNENRSNNLKSLAMTFCNAEDYGLDLSTPDAAYEYNYRDLLRYNCLDAWYTIRLYDYFCELLKDPELEGLWKAYNELLRPGLELIIKCETTGVYIDKARLTKLLSRSEKLMNKYLVNLNKLINEKGYWEGDINLNSPKQVSRLLFENMNLKPNLKLDNVKLKSGGYTTSQEHLTLLGDANAKSMKEGSVKEQVVGYIVKYRIIHKLVSGFLRPFADKIYQGRIWPKFKIVGTVTGRMSSEDPNFQQIPRANAVRSLICAPHGYKLIDTDLEQAELRVAAQVSKDREMMRIFIEGGDIHAETASIFKGISVDEVSKEDRKKAKAVNFGLLYDMSAHGLQQYAMTKYDVMLTEGEAKMFRMQFFEKYERLKDYHRSCVNELLQYGYVTSLFGRRRRLGEPNILRRAMQERTPAWGNAKREAINFKIQSVSHDIALLGGIMFWKEYKCLIREADVKLYGEVHDSLILICRERYAELVGKSLVKVIENLPVNKVFGFNFIVPIKASMKISDSWQGQKF